MTTDKLKNEFEIRNLKRANKELKNSYSCLNNKYKNLNEQFKIRVENQVKKEIKPKEKEIRELKRTVSIKIDLEQRLRKKLEKKNEIINDKNEQIKELKYRLLEMEKEIDNLKKSNEESEAKLNLDGTNAGIPTSQTPINKNKKVPNSREKSERAKGGQPGHKKKKLEKFNDDEIDEINDIGLDKCPHCDCKELEELDEYITKDEYDYEIRIIKRRNRFKIYKCLNCQKIVRAPIPKDLKEDNQYGKIVQAHALSLTNMANVPFNKTRRIISGITSNEINLSEGYIAKLQKRASKLLENFIKELKDYIISLDTVHWDDTVIFVNTKRACLRFYGDDDIALYTAHETKGKEGLIEDDVLNKITERQKVVHDHNKVNYNEAYVYINVECCQHLERDLEKVKLNIPESTWSKELKDLFSSYNSKRNEYIKTGKDSFTLEETNEFMIKFDKNILLGLEENKKHEKSHYFTNEKALLTRLLEYRDNYTYWLYDFSIPFTNNTSERALRGVKTKMKVSGQFSNIDYAKYYANIKSYIDTCHRNGINEVNALVRLLNDNPYTISEILEISSSQNKNEEL